MSSKPSYEELVKQVKELEKTKTALLKTRAALKDSEEKYRTTFESITDSITVTRVSDGLYIYVNDGFCKQTGYSREEVLGKRPSDLCLYEKQSERDQFISILKKYGKAENVVVSFRRKNGELFYSEFSAKPIKYAQEDCLLGQSRDITTRKLAEKALRASHERFLTVLDSIDATIYVGDMETHEIIFMNKNMIDTFGRDMTGETCYKSFRGKKKPCSQCTNDQLVDENGNRTGVRIWQEENPVTKRWYINYDRAIEWTDGRMVRLQIATDITDHKKIEEQLRQAQKMESVGRLAGGVAHDFNNMLSIILGNTEIILEDLDLDNPVVENLHEIRRAAERSSKLTKQLLAFARKQTIMPEVLDLNTTITGMHRMLKRLIGEDIDFAWIPGKKLWSVKADPSQIDQILANLCVNARDSIKDVGRITIETENITFDEEYCHQHEGFRPGRYAAMVISDTGCGIDKDTMKNLFEPFFTTKSIGKGTGLGLATVYGIVKQNNGFINVYSEPDKGTTFKVYLPEYITEHTFIENTELEDFPTTGSETILLVEDENSILKMTQMMLERFGYKVLSAHNPLGALHIGRSNPENINLLITDVVMPEMNGRDLAKKLLEVYPSMKCLFMSGYTANVIAHHGVLDEGVEFINKPFSKQELAKKVRKVLDMPD